MSNIIYLSGVKLTLHEPDYNDVNLCFDAFKEAIKMRSDCAEDFLQKCIQRANIQDASIGDNNVNEFLQRNRLSLIDREKNRKTPDILIYTGGTNILYLGDVAVSNSSEDVEKIKDEKYENMRGYIREVNMGKLLRIESFNIVLDHKLQNLGAVIDKIKSTLNIDIDQEDVKELSRNIRAINNYTKAIERNVRDFEVFKQLKLEDNKMSDIFQRLNEYGGGKIIEKQTPKKSRGNIFSQIIESIKKRVIGDKVKAEDQSFREKIINEIKEEQELKETKIRDVRTPIRFVMNLEDEEDKQDIDLLEDYMMDLTANGVSSGKIIEYMPNSRWPDKAKGIKKYKRDHKYDFKIENGKVKHEIVRDEMKKQFGQDAVYFCSEKDRASYDVTDNIYLSEKKKVKRRNEKTTPKTIDISNITLCEEHVEKISSYLSEENEKFKSIEYDIDNYDTPKQKNRDLKNLEEFSEEFDMINKSKALIYCNNIRKFVNDCSHMPSGLKDGMYYSIPQLKNCIFIILCWNNVGSNNPTIIYKTITRFKKETYEKKQYIIGQLFKGIVERIEETEKYMYVLSITMSDNLSVLSKLKNVDMQIRMHALSSVSYIEGKKERKTYLRKYLGLSTIVSTDLHQCPSSLLDLMKYVVGMTLSNWNNIGELLSDKLKKLYKTSLDLFIISRIIDFYVKNINSLNKYNKVISSREVTKLTKEKIEEFFSAWSFFDLDINIKKKEMYLQECQLLFQLRPKKLYKSQFIDKAQLSVVEFNRNMESEIEKELLNNNIGLDENNDPDYSFKEFNFNAKHMFDSDAVIQMTNMQNREIQEYRNKIYGKVKSSLEDFAINNTSMRGSCITLEEIREKQKEKYEKISNENKRRILSVIQEEEEEDEIEEEEEEEKGDENKKEEKKEKLKKYGKNKEMKIGFSSTSVLTGIKLCEEKIKNGDNEGCKIINIVKEGIDKTQYYNMSEKEQRGDGRPIAAPDALTKQKLFLLEAPFAAASDLMDNNLLGKSKNRAATLAGTIQKVKEDGLMNGRKIMGYFVQDQSKFSEGDNLDKFIVYIKNSDIVPDGLKEISIKVLENMKGRLQHFPRNSKKLIKDFRQYIDESTLFVLGSAGWPQGMLNRISTCFHLGFSNYLCELYNENVKEEDKVSYANLVNSDDSLTIVSAKNINSITKMYHFMERGKKMACLRQNEKKSYLSLCSGEIIQLFYISDSVINMWSKQLCSISENIIGIDMSRDITSCVGSLGNCYSNGAPEDVLTFARYEVKKKIFREYNLGKGKVNDVSPRDIDITLLPCEMGGWPGLPSTFELCVAGHHSQNNSILMRFYEKKVKVNKDIEKLKEKLSNEEKIIITSLLLSMMSKNMNDYLKTYDAKEKITSEMENNYEIKRIREIREQLKSITNINSDENDGEDESMNDIIDELSTRLASKSKQYIELVGEASSTDDNSLIRKLISCYRIIFPINKKISETIKKMREFDYKSNPLGTLLKEKKNVQTALANRIQMAQEEVIAISENKIIGDARKRASTTSYIAFNNCIKIPFTEELMTIKGYFVTLLKIYNNIVKSKFYENIIKSMDLIFSDSTNRSQIAYNVVLYSDEEARSAGKGNIIVNKKPNLLDDLGIKNNINIVLVWIMDKTYLIDQGVRIRFPDAIESDSLTIKNKYRIWLELSNTKSIVESIYFNYLNIRRQRWQVAPFLRTGNEYDYYFDLLMKSRHANDEMIGRMDIKAVTESKGISKSLIAVEARSLLGCIELYNFGRKKGIEKERLLRKIKTNIDGEEKNLEEIVKSGELMAVFNELDDHDKRIICGFELEATENNKDKATIEYMKQDDYIINWVKAQRTIVETSNGRSRYVGDFKVQVSRGKNSILIVGEPGNITEVKSNNLDPHAITDLYGFFFTQVKFDGYTKPKNKRMWPYNNVCKTENKTSMFVVSQNILSSIERRFKTQEKFIRNKSRIESEELVKNVLINKFVFNRNENNDRYNNLNVIPVELDYSLRNYQVDKKELIEVKYDAVNNQITNSRTVEDKIMKRDRQIKEKIIRVPKSSRNSIFSMMQSSLVIDGVRIKKIIDMGILGDMIKGRVRELKQEQIESIIDENVEIDETIKRSFMSLLSYIFGRYYGDDDESDMEVVRINIKGNYIEELVNSKYTSDEVEDIIETMVAEDNYNIDLNLNVGIENSDLKETIMKGLGKRLKSNKEVSIINGILLTETGSKIVKQMYSAINKLKMDNDIRYKFSVDDNDEIIDSASEATVRIVVLKEIVGRINAIIEDIKEDELLKDLHNISINKFDIFVDCVINCGEKGQNIKNNMLLKQMLNIITKDIKDYVSSKTRHRKIKEMRREVFSNAKENKLNILDTVRFANFIDEHMTENKVKLFKKDMIEDFEFVKRRDSIKTVYYEADDEIESVEKRVEVDEDDVSTEERTNSNESVPENWDDKSSDDSFGLDI